MKKSIILKIVWIGGFILFGYSILLYSAGMLERFGLGKIMGGFVLMIIGLLVAFYGLKAEKRNKLSLIVADKQPKFLKSIGFHETVKVPIDYYRTFFLDKEKGQIFVTPIFRNEKEVKFNDNCIFDLKNMLDVSLRKNEKKIAETKGGMGGALVGAALFGTAGAIVGSNMTKKTTTKTQVTSLKINILTRNYKDPLWTIKFLENRNPDQSEYLKLAKSAEEIYSILQAWFKEANEIKPNVTKANTNKVKLEKNEKDDVSKLREYKKLLDEGIITSEEFELKKKQILNL